VAIVREYSAEAPSRVENKKKADPSEAKLISSNQQGCSARRTPSVRRRAANLESYAAERLTETRLMLQIHRGERRKAGQSERSTVAMGSNGWPRF
jgi:hypothetical protein